MKVGDLIVYVPNHAVNIYDKGCEVGIIKSMNEQYIFANYYSFRSSLLQQTAQATPIRNIKPFPFLVGDMCYDVDCDGEIYSVVTIHGEYISVRYEDGEVYRRDYRMFRLSRQSKINRIVNNL
jgi:hypothetical protein